MPLWGKSSEEGKRKRKAKKGSGVDTVQGSFRIVLEENGERSGLPGTHGHSSDQRPSPSLQVSHSQIFSASSNYQSHPSTGGHPRATHLIDSRLATPNQTAKEWACLPSLFCPSSKFEHIVDEEDYKYIDIEYATPPADTYNSSVGKSGYFSIKSHGNSPLLSSARRLTPSSGHISGPSYAEADVTQLIHRQHRRPSNARIVTLSPIMEHVGPSSRVNNSDANTPLHQRVAGPSLEDQILWPGDRKKQSYRLPLPPASNPVPTPPSYTSPVKPDNLPIGGSKWKKGRLLGWGTFGHVYHGFNNESGQMCAIKQVTLHTDDPKANECARQLSQEIALLSQLHHPNIVQYYGSEMVDENVYIYLEYVPGGSIHKLLNEHGTLGEAAVRSYTKQILSGLAYLHAKKTAHRDVKGANILVQPDGLVKLADFGMAKHINGAIGPMSFKGSPYWIAPEVVLNSNADVSVDIWSLGCTVLEMATGQPPWGQCEGVAALFKIGHSNEIPPIPESLSEECKDFVRKCLQRDPLKRPTAAVLLEHQFVKSLTTPVGNLSPRSQSPRYTSALPPPISIPGSSIPTSPDIGAVQFQNNWTPKHMSAIFTTTYIATPPGSPSSAAGNVMPYHPLSAKHRYETSPLLLSSSPGGASGPSEQLAGGNVSLPFRPKSPRKNMHGEPVSMLRPHTSSSSSPNTSYQDVNPDLFPRVTRTPITTEVITMHSPVRRDQIQSNVLDTRQNHNQNQPTGYPSSD